MAKEDFVYTVCQGTGCHDHCVLKTYVADGKITHTERVVLPPPEGDRPGICQKGIMAAKLPYSPERIKYPMKRVGERGEGKFERISWEQAMDEIGARLREYRDTYGPESIGVLMFPCGMAPVFGLWQSLATRFLNVFGGTYLMGTTIDTGPFFADFIDFGSSWYYLRYDKSLLSKSNYIILWGAEPITTRPATGPRWIVEAQERGVKVVSVGLTFDPTAAKADWFIKVKPGSDAALALAMARYIIDEGLYDEEFLNKHTVAPFLVREDTGQFLRESDIEEGGDAEKYVILSKIPAKPMAVEAHSFEYPEGIVPDLTAKIMVRGIPCKTAFVKLRESLEDYTLEGQEKITGVPAEWAKKLADEYVSNKPATIWYDWGLGRYYNGQRACRALNLLAALSGNLGLPGGRIIPATYGAAPGIYSWDIPYNDMAILFPDGFEAAKSKWMYHADAIEAVQTGKPHPLKAILHVAGNVLHSLPSRHEWQKLFSNVELLVTYEIRMTDTAMWADYILPDLSVFERYDLVSPAAYNHLILQQPAIAPIGEGKPPAEFWKEIAKQLGLEKYFDKTTEEWIDLWLKSEHPSIADIKPPVTFARLNKEKAIRANVPQEPFDPFYTLDFLTPSGRVEIYCEELASIGEAVPRYIEPYVRGPKSKEYPLQFYSARSRFFMQTQFRELPELAKLAGEGPTLRINPVDAAPRGIKNGDIVEVFNQRGKMKVKAVLSECIPPGTVHVWYGWRKKDYIEGAHNLLLTPHSTPETADELLSGWWNYAGKRYPMPPQFNLEQAIATGWDVIWDNLCEVKKA